jgi:hypothetical protein
LESDLRQTSDIAEAAVFRLGTILQELNLDCYAARCRMRNLSGEQAIVRTDCRADDPQNIALPPFVTPDEPHLRRRIGLNLLEFPLWKIEDSAYAPSRGQRFPKIRKSIRFGLNKQLVGESTDSRIALKNALHVAGLIA